MKPLRDYVGEPEKMHHDIAFARVAFSEQALAIMATRPEDDDGTTCSNSAFADVGAGAGGGSSGGGGGGVSGGENWDRRLARPENFLQLCRDDTCGKMRTLKVSYKKWVCRRQNIRGRLSFHLVSLQCCLLLSCVVVVSFWWYILTLLLLQSACPSLSCL